MKVGESVRLRVKEVDGRISREVLDESCNNCNVRIRFIAITSTNDLIDRTLIFPILSNIRFEVRRKI
jgi:hypothetical protein